jgi:chromosome partitioning protein
MITVVGNMKGGTGKSTLTFNLAVWLAHQQNPLRLFDLDPQQTLTDVVDVRTEEQYQPTLPMPHLLNDLKEFEKTPGHILMDVSMSDQESLTHAIRLADQIIIPVAPSQADIWSTQRFIKLIKETRTDLPKMIAVINRADTHPFVAETKETEDALDYLPHIERLPTRLHNRTNYRRSFSEGLAVFEMDPSGKASHEFIKVAKQIFKE